VRQKAPSEAANHIKQEFHRLHLFRPIKTVKLKFHLSKIIKCADEIAYISFQ
jgi:hypothetical protein